MSDNNIRIVFFGTPDFAVESLRALVEAGFDIAAVVTGVDKPAGRGKHLKQSAVKEYALSVGLPVLQPDNLKEPAFLAELRTTGANLFVVIAFRMLPHEVWGMPQYGTFNLHASLLPRYRGAAPINWAVINGDTHTGVTTFFLQEKMDTGDVIESRSIAIGENENVGSVHDRLMVLGAELTLDTVRRIASGDLSATPQDSLPGGVAPTPAPKIFKDTCHIDWNRPARELHNFVRGLSPYPGAWSQLIADGADAGTFKIFETRPASRQVGQPGEVTVNGDCMYVGCGDSALQLLSVQVQGKRRMDVAEFLRGCRYESMVLK
ncbi:MAG: methionyl-tRNA formyltransferase [Paramuribaculum sp.]|nr:methionyl-tRNA formyltransferase [Paramuribaculum sp.]